MSKAAFRQIEVERIISAAERKGAIVQIDLRTMVVNIFPAIHSQSDVDPTPKHAPILPPGNIAQDGKENWDDYED
jgi:hypothetical protein